MPCNAQNDLQVDITDSENAAETQLVDFPSPSRQIRPEPKTVATRPQVSVFIIVLIARAFRPAQTSAQALSSSGTRCTFQYQSRPTDTYSAQPSSSYLYDPS